MRYAQHANAPPYLHPDLHVPGAFLAPPNPPRASRATENPLFNAHLNALQSDGSFGDRQQFNRPLKPRFRVCANSASRRPSATAFRPSPRFHGPFRL